MESVYKQYGSEFLSLMPTNLYGPNDNYDLKNSHVIPALIKKIYSAKIKSESNITVWGSGNPKRESFCMLMTLLMRVYFLSKTSKLNNL